MHAGSVTHHVDSRPVASHLQGFRDGPAGNIHSAQALARHGEHFVVVRLRDIHKRSLNGESRTCIRIGKLQPVHVQVAARDEQLEYMFALGQLDRAHVDFLVHVPCRVHLRHGNGLGNRLVVDEQLEGRSLGCRRHVRGNLVAGIGSDIDGVFHPFVVLRVADGKARAGRVTTLGIVNRHDVDFVLSVSFALVLAVVIVESLVVAAHVVVLGLDLARHRCSDIVVGSLRVTKGMKSESKNAKADINTFSKEFLKMLKGNPESYTEAGKEIINSFNDGVKDAITKTKDKVSSTVENYFTNLEKDNEKAQENLQKQIDKTTNKTKKKKLQSQLNDLKEQNKQIKELYSKFGKDVISEFGKAMESATNGVTTKLTKNIENLTKKMQSEIDAVENAIDSMRNKLTDYGELYTTYTDKDTGAEIVHLSDIKKQTEALNKYYSNLTKLKGKVSEELLTEITNMSVEDATKFSNTLLALDKSELQAYDKAYKEKLAVADKISKQFYASKLNDIKVNYTDKIKAEFNNAKKEIKKIGEQTMQGFIDGMNSKNYTGAVKTMADNIIKQMKKSLGIHSPSKVFMELGDYSAQGYGQGFTKEMKTVIADMKNAVIPDFSNETVETLNNTPSTSQLDLISAFKEALSQMKIELDDDEVGSFVEKTVANAIYT